MRYLDIEESGSIQIKKAIREMLNPQFAPKWFFDAQSPAIPKVFGTLEETLGS